MPSLLDHAKKVGDAYTIFGAIHDLKSRIHSREITAKDVTITGYIVESNYATAPKCATTRPARRTPTTASTSPFPSFWIADKKGDTKGQKIRVLGWAKNWATIFDAMEKYKDLKDPPKELVKDDVWERRRSVPAPRGRREGEGHRQVRLHVHEGVDRPRVAIRQRRHDVREHGVIEPGTEPAAFGTPKKK